MDKNILLVFAIMCSFEHGESLPALDLPVPAAGSNSIDAKHDFLESVYDCTDKGSVPCFKYKLFAFVDRVLNKDEINLTNGITVVRTAPGVDGAPRALEMSDNADMTNMIVKRLEQFLSTHVLKVDLRGTDVLNAVTRAGRTLDEISEGFGHDVSEEDIEIARKKGGGGGGKKGSKMMGSLLMMIKMKLLALIPIAFGIIALIAGKALIIGKIALLLSLIIALKKLLASHQKTVTYEIVSHPHHASGGGHDAYSSGGAAAVDYGASYSGGGGSSHGGWGRSSDAAQELAYKGYKPSDSKLD